MSATQFRSIFLVVVLASSCGDAERRSRTADTAATVLADKPRPHTEALKSLREHEEKRRGITDFAALPSYNNVAGADPYRVRTSSSGGIVGVLRGADAVVVLDADAREQQRLPAPPSPTALAADDHEVFVAGELAGEIARYRWRDGALERAGQIALPGVLGIRDLALGNDGLLYVVEEVEGRLLSVEPASGAVREIDRCHGPVQVQRSGDYVLVACLLDHAIVAHRVDRVGSGEPAFRIEHDGPIWSFDTSIRGDRLFISLAGIEDHVLDRTWGGFGYIDSFVFLYAVDDDRAERVAQVNVSALGAITPKWIELRAIDDELVAVATGYGGDSIATIAWRDPTGPPIRTASMAAPPGITELARVGDRIIGANALLDGWVVIDDGRTHLTSVPDDRPARSVEQRIGEALLFTVLMAPWNGTEGYDSRFTCEACHYEGYGDGRVHFTGRDEIHAATKPLHGLFNNRPHFSRALDRSTTQMINNEFKVANKRTGRDPWFSLQADDFPWLASFGDVPESLDPVFLRRSMMTFLHAYTHRPNPRTHGRDTWTDLERAGAEMFRDRCEQCHNARTVADDADTRVVFERWESLVMRPAGPIVWGRSSYRKTGVTPYVHPKGARVPSLRRLYKKWPHFTNGSAASVDDVLAGAREVDGVLFHGSAPGNATALTDNERVALRAFVDLL